MLPTRFRFIWQSGFRSEEKIVQKSTNQKQEFPEAAMLPNGSKRNEHSLQRTFQGCFLPNFDSFGQVVIEEKMFQKSTNQKQELPVVAMLPTKFRYIWPIGFREDLKKQSNHKQELPVAAIFVNGSEQNYQSLQRTCHRCFLPSFSSFG